MAETTPSTAQPLGDRPRGRSPLQQQLVGATAGEADAPRVSSWARNPVWPFVVLGTGMVGFGLVLLVLSRHLWFFQDEYFWILHRGRWSANAFLVNTNGHFMLVPLVIYKLLFVTVGLGQTWPYRLVLVCLHLTCVLLLYVIAARRVGRWFALVPAGLLLVLGSAAPDLMFAIQIGFVGSIAAWLGALLCLDRGDGMGDRIAALLLFVSLASEGIGIPLALAVLVELMITRSTRRRVWVALIPLALYALWYLGYGASEVLSGNIRMVPSYDAAIASYGFAGLFGVPRGVGNALLVGAVIWLGHHLLNGRRLSPRTITCVLAALGFWTVVALTRAQYHEPQAARYVYASGLLILLAFFTVVQRPQLTVTAAVAFAGLVAFAGIANFTPLQQYAHDRTSVDTLVRSELGAAEVAGPAANPGFVPDAHHLPWLDEAQYLHAVHELGSPAFTSQQILVQSQSDREAADSVLVRADGVSLEERPSAQELSDAAPASIGHSTGLLVSRASVASSGSNRGCTRLTPDSAAPSATTVVAPGQRLYVSLLGEGRIAIYIHRLASHTSQPLQVLARSSTPAVLSFPRDASNLPWHVRLAPSARTVACLV